AYYAAIDGRRYADVWNVLSPAVRTRFGGFDKWRAGYSTTVADRPTGLRVTAGSNASVVVRGVLAANDTDCDGPLRVDFVFTLRRDPAGGWSVANLTASRSGPAPTC